MENEGNIDDGSFEPEKAERILNIINYNNEHLRFSAHYKCLGTLRTFDP